MDILDYHRRSKHRLERYAPGPGHLDWASQPDPFREFVEAPRVALPLAAGRLTTRFGALRSGRLPEPAPLDIGHIGALFELSLGLSAWKEYGGTRWALRCNPSSGNLHPTEGYLVCGGVAGIEPGVYHYLPRDHLLERRCVLPAGSPEGGILVGLSSIYWREAWKYGIRAFRYCQHDCGHAIGAFAYAAAALGWRARVLERPGDAEVAALLGLDREADFVPEEREEPEVLIWVGAGPIRADFPPPPGEASCWSGSANRLSESHADWPDIALAHAATRKPGTTGEDFRGYAGLAAPPPPALDLTAAELIRRRRSAVAFDGETGMSFDALCTLLEATLPRSDAVPWNAWPCAPRVNLGLFVHRVSGLEPGLYLLLRNPHDEAALRRAMRPEWLWDRRGTPGLPLYLLLPHDLRQVARLVSCHQDIAADSCFSLGMLASFEGMGREPWRYRQLYWECGLIGQALYLEAEAAGLRATGIGCFFDDEMHRLLGLRDGAWQSLYHFTVGGPVDDARLTTLQPYAHLRRREFGDRRDP